MGTVRTDKGIQTRRTVIIALTLIVIGVGATLYNYSKKPPSSSTDAASVNPPASEVEAKSETDAAAESLSAETPAEVASIEETATQEATGVSSPEEDQEETLSEDPFVGWWMNENSSTEDVTRVAINTRSGNLSVHMWARCRPLDCDWGTKEIDPADREDGVLSLIWEKESSVTKQTLSLLPDGRLKVDGNTRFTDGSGEADVDSTQYFFRR